MAVEYDTAECCALPTPPPTILLLIGPDSHRRYGYVQALRSEGYLTLVFSPGDESDHVIRNWRPSLAIVIASTNSSLLTQYDPETLRHRWLVSNVLLIMDKPGGDRPYRPGITLADSLQGSETLVAQVGDTLDRGVVSPKDKRMVANGSLGNE